MLVYLMSLKEILLKQYLLVVRLEYLKTSLNLQILLKSSRGNVKKSEQEQELAKRMGWECIKDTTRGVGFYRFKKGDVFVWAVRNGLTPPYWLKSTALHIAKEQKRFRTLEEALRDEDGN